MYKVYHEFDEHDCLEWHVYEKSTEQIIATFFFEEDAVELATLLERGMGFAGFTPTFMLRKHSLEIGRAHV